MTLREQFRDRRLSPIVDQLDVAEQKLAEARELIAEARIAIVAVAQSAEGKA